MCGERDCTRVAIETKATYHRISGAWITPKVLGYWCRLLGVDLATVQELLSQDKSDPVRIASHHFLDKYFRCAPRLSARDAIHLTDCRWAQHDRRPRAALHQRG